MISGRPSKKHEPGISGPEAPLQKAPGGCLDLAHDTHQNQCAVEPQLSLRFDWRSHGEDREGFLVEDDRGPAAEKTRDGWRIPG